MDRFWFMSCYLDAQKLVILHPLCLWGGEWRCGLLHGLRARMINCGMRGWTKKGDWWVPDWHSTRHCQQWIWIWIWWDTLYFIYLHTWLTLTGRGWWTGWGQGAGAFGSFVICTFLPAVECTGVAGEKRPKQQNHQTEIEILIRIYGKSNYFSQ